MMVNALLVLFIFEGLGVIVAQENVGDEKNFGVEENVGDEKNFGVEENVGDEKNFGVEENVGDEKNVSDTDILHLSVTESPSSSSSQWSDEEIIKQWDEGFVKLKTTVKSLVKGALPYLVSSSSNIDAVSPQCRKAGLQLLVALQKVEPWSLYMLDASGKVMSGILKGTLTSFGSYDECLGIVATEKKRNKTKEIFHGKYCTVKVRPFLPKKPRFYTLGKRIDAFKIYENDTGIMGEVTKNVQVFYTFPFRFGVCVPSPCSAGDIHQIVKLITKKVMEYDILEPVCEVKQSNKVENFQIPVLVVFSCLVAIVLCGTCTELSFLYLEYLGKKNTRKDSTVIKCLLAFSAYRNFKVLLNADSASDKLKVLHGIRVYSISWIILGHSFYYVEFSMIKHLHQTVEISKQVAFSVVSNATLVVDNFFFISGLLMTYVTMNILEKSGRKLNVFHFIIHRLWRLLPIQMAFVGVTLLLPWMGSGPLWHETIDPLVEGCRKEWWTHLLFINNLYRKTRKGCVSYSWYLAADFQLYIFSLVVLIPLLRKPRVGVFINVFLIVAQVLASGLYTYLRDLPPAVLFSNPDETQRTQLMMETYYVPLQHLGPFFIGILTGYYMQSHPPLKRIHPAIQVVAWIAAIVMSSSALFGIHGWNSGQDPGKVAGAIYAAMCRVSWATAVAWMVFACSSGYGGILTSLLSWKPLIPLSRLTFLIYMVHPMILQMFYANMREGYQANNFAAVYVFFSVLPMGFGIGAILCLFFESPFINLGKIIFESQQQKGETSTTLRAQQQISNKLSNAKLDSVLFEPPLTNLRCHSSDAELIVSPTNGSETKAFENVDVVYRL